MMMYSCEDQRASSTSNGPSSSRGRRIARCTARRARWAASTAGWRPRRRAGPDRSRTCGCGVRRSTSESSAHPYWTSLRQSSTPSVLRLTLRTTPKLCWRQTGARALRALRMRRRPGARLCCSAMSAIARDAHLSSIVATSPGLDTATAGAAWAAGAGGARRAGTGAGAMAGVPSAGLARSSPAGRPRPGNTTC